MLQLLVSTTPERFTKKGVVIPVEGGRYRLVTSGGRIGDHYGVQTHEVKLFDLEDAKTEFKNLFYEKTQNKWEKRNDFERQKKSWNYVKKIYDVVIDEETRKKDFEESTLPKPVKELLYQVSDLSLIRRTMEEAGLDWRIMPLGRVDTSVIKAAHDILKKIELVLNRQDEYRHLRGVKRLENQKEVEKLSKTIPGLSNEFYMLIPHNFYNTRNANAYGYARPREIDNKILLKEKVHMLDNLREVSATLELLSNPPAYTPGKTLLDGIYDSVCMDIKPLPVDDSRYKLIQQYIGQSHSVTILEIFKISRWSEKETFQPFKENRDKRTQKGEPANMLLFHGTRLTNVLGILSQGLKIAPPEAPATGYMFGKGIYTADTFQKSLNYCHSHTYEKLMFMCEVSTGETYNCFQAEDMTAPPAGYASTKGIGKNAPSASDLLVTTKGVSVPLGPLQTPTLEQVPTLNFNEYIVYNQNQVQLKYLIKFR